LIVSSLECCSANSAGYSGINFQYKLIKIFSKNVTHKKWFWWFLKSENIQNKLFHSFTKLDKEIETQKDHTVKNLGTREKETKTIGFP
jgi:hypothetical protein